MDYSTIFLDPELNVLEGQAAIYGLSDPERPEDGVRYVGKTAKSIEARRRVHAGNGRWAHRYQKDGTHLTRWLRGLAARGVEPVSMALEITTPDKLDAAEDWWINELRRRGFDLVNTAPGGTGGLRGNAKKTPEERREIGLRAAATRRERYGSESPLRGKKQAPEHVAKRLAAIDYKKASETHRAQHAARAAAGIPHHRAGKPGPNLGKAIPPDVRKKISETVSASWQDVHGSRDHTATAKKAWATRVERYGPQGTAAPVTAWNKGKRPSDDAIRKGQEAAAARKAATGFRTQRQLAEQIAEKAGCSTAQVGRTLKTPDGQRVLVAADVQRRIWDAYRDLGAQVDAYIVKREPRDGMSSP